MDTIMGFFWMAVVIALYFLPTIVAAKRGHNNTDPIFILNLTLGWTGIGWLLAFMWSFSYNRP